MKSEKRLKIIKMFMKFLVAFLVVTTTVNAQLPDTLSITSIAYCGNCFFCTDQLMFEPKELWLRDIPKECECYAFSEEHEVILNLNRFIINAEMHMLGAGKARTLYNAVVFLQYNDGTLTQLFLSGLPYKYVMIDGIAYEVSNKFFRGIKQILPGYCKKEFRIFLRRAKLME